MICIKEKERNIRERLDLLNSTISKIDRELEEIEKRRAGLLYPPIQP